MISRRTLGYGALGTALVLVPVLLFARALQRGQGVWLAGFVLCFVVVCLLVPRLKARATAHYREREPGTLVIDAAGVSRTFEGRSEAVAWAELSAVKVLTTSEGPYADGVYFLLVGDAGRACLVPFGLAEAHDLLASLKRRLPELDEAKVRDAVGSTEDAAVTIWSRRG